MTIKVLSDSVLLVQVARRPGAEGLAAVQTINSRLRGAGWPEILEVVPASTSLAVHISRGGSLLEMRRRLEELVGEASNDGAIKSSARERVIPVCYGGAFGPDLDRVATAVGMSREAVIERHLAGDYTVMAVGFAPGFPYLTGLDPALHCPRLATPRLQVPAGSVGIGGEQTGVYPQELPGGWNLIGRTDRVLFDLAAAEPAWLRVGDRVKFESVPDCTAIQQRAKPAPSITTTPPELVAGIEVVRPGVQTTVQDLGRPGYQNQGVTVGGALNRRALQVANTLVGNAPNVPALEFALRGPLLRFHEARLVVVTGTMVAEVPFARPFVVEAGQELNLTKIPAGGRGVLAVSGGLAVAPVLGSGSTHLAARFGGWYGRALRQGDLLPLKSAQASGAQSGWWISPTWVGGAAEPISTVRVLKGPEADAFGAAGWAALLASPYQIEPDSNRMGLRLKGGEVKLVEPLEMISGPVALGTIQVPASGQPIVLMADRQTLGGYPRIASVISADLAVMAQAPLGARVQFVEIDLAEAEALRDAEMKDLGLLAAAMKARLVFPE